MANFRSITWNIESLKSHKFTLKYFVDLVEPHFIYLNETLLFQFEANAATDLLRGEYEYTLNSDDVFDPELPFIRNKSHGGTMIFWKKSLSEFISVLSTPSASFSALLFRPPGSPSSLQVALYLPTSGKETEFIDEITSLRIFIEDLLIKDPDLLVFIRGDSNVNVNQAARTKMFENFKATFNLLSLPVGHKTYHHFLGNGLFDSAIDVILYTKSKTVSEQLVQFFCKHDHPDIRSHHDAIVSTFTIPKKSAVIPPPTFQAPEIPNTRRKIFWNQDTLPLYQALVDDTLSCIRNRWLEPSSESCVAVLLRATSEILSTAAAMTNKSVSLSEATPPKSNRTPKAIKHSRNYLKRRLSIFRNIRSQTAAEKLEAAKINHRKLVRSFISHANSMEYSRMFSLMSSGTSGQIFKRIRAYKKPPAREIPYLNVGTQTYHGNDVKNGFYASISQLKKKEENVDKKATHIDYKDDYKNILDLCLNKRDLPNISVEDSSKILTKMKATVTDLYDITPAHFINAGLAGLKHFNFLLNCIINDVNNASIEELNSCYALLLYKGHGKLRTNDTAYRTISSCPLASKALDFYIRDLHVEKWNNVQALTQYQGEGSCHDLAALLVTEVVQHSVYTLKQPAYLLFLDARSAFDRVVPELLIRSLYLAGMNGNTTNYINKRITNRVTYIDWERRIMGPISDELGLEQGGANSSDLYKIYSNDHLKTAQNSHQGVNIGNDPHGNPLVISAVGLADDTCLVSNKLSKLFNILSLTNIYCEKYGVTLCPSKTKLLCVSPKIKPEYLETFNPININGEDISFSSEAEHVGTIRSIDGNLPHILNRLAAHRKAMSATLSSGVACKSRVNPVVSLRLEKTYGSPVLLSGLSSLVIGASEFSVIDQHYKNTYQNIQKLHSKTPRSFVYFLGGSLPAQALIHLRMLTLFGMVARLSGDPLNVHARNALVSAKTTSKSWFCQLRDVCLLYNLPHPISLLDCPPSKDDFKKQITAHVTSYWETKLRGEATLLPSLCYFKPEFMSLKSPHLLWKTAGSNPYEVAKAVQQARFLSGRYRTGNLEKHWSQNKEGICHNCHESTETTEHILIFCKAYNETKKNLYSLWLSTKNPVVYQLVLKALSSDTEYLLQFILDCSVLPNIIAAAQEHGSKIYHELFYMTRTWCFAIHRQRMKGLGRWNFK